MVANITTGRDVYGALAYNQGKMMGTGRYSPHGRAMGTPPPHPPEYQGDESTAPIWGSRRMGASRGGGETPPAGCPRTSGRKPVVTFAQPDSEGTAPPPRRGGGWALHVPRGETPPPRIPHFRTEKPVSTVAPPKTASTTGSSREIAGGLHGLSAWAGEDNLISYSNIPTSDGSISISCRCRWPQDGRKINDSRRNERSVAVTEELEREYGLHPAKGRRREKGQRDRPRRLHVGRPETPGGSGNKTGRGDIPLQTLGEFRALLSLI